MKQKPAANAPKELNNLLTTPVFLWNTKYMNKKTKKQIKKVEKMLTPKRKHNAYVLGVDVSRHPAVFAGVGVLLATGIAIIFMGLR